MGQTYWKQTEDVGFDPQAIVVDEKHPLPVQIIQIDDRDIPPVRVEQAYMPPAAGVAISRRLLVPGIATASAYSSGDAFGTLLTIPDVFRANKNSGTVTKLALLDKDDEGLQKDCIFFEVGITTTADHDEYAISDNDLLSCQGAASITTYFNFANNQVGVWTGTHRVESQDTNLYIRLVTRGADNIAAGSEPWLLVTVVPD